MFLQICSVHAANTLRLVVQDRGDLLDDLM